MDELKACNKACDELRLQNEQLQQKQTNIEEEYTKYTENVRQRNEADNVASFNLRRVKMQLRQRSDAIRKHLRYDIDLLNRLRGDDRCDRQSIDLMRDKFEMQYDMEIQKQNQLEAMYESEAKNAWDKQQDTWAKEAITRDKLLKGLINEQMQQVNGAIAHVDKQRKELDTTRETHRQAIGSTIGRIKDLTVDQRQDDGQMMDAATSPDTVPDANGNVELKNSKATIDQAMEALAIGDGIARPKFGRKKVAWT